MAAMAGALTSVDVWNRFRYITGQRVEEGNFLAGERFWEIVPSGDSEAALTIRCTRSVGDAIECAFDPDSGALTCAPGAAIDAPLRTFYLQTQAPGTVLSGGVEYTLDDAVNLLLDELVWLDEDEEAGS